MESISKAVHNASNAIWSEVDALRGGQQEQTTQTTEQRVPQQHGEEPISGIQGKGTVADPFDAGNRDDQPGASHSKENSAVITEPLSSICPSTSTESGTSTSTGTGTFQNKYRRPSEKATLVTSGIGPINPTIEHPTPVSGKEHSSGLAAKDTPKDEPISSHGNTLKDESVSTTSVAPDEPEATSTSKSSASAAAPSTTGSTATESPSEQRSQSSTSQAEKKDQKGAGESSSGVSSEASAHKKGISEEALKGPKCPPPRESYEKQKKFDDAGKDDELTDQPKTSKPEGKSNEKGNKSAHHDKESHEHHHKTVKERIDNMLHHH